MACHPVTAALYIKHQTSIKREDVTIKKYEAQTAKPLGIEKIIAYMRKTV